jgi:3-oxoacyl-[acyl-carrier-protein] synthase-3
MNGLVAAIDYFLPLKELSTKEIALQHPDWSAEKIDAKTGIKIRHHADQHEYASDLACSAADKLFESGVVQPSMVDFLLVCTQTPDYSLPTTACLLQHRLKIPSSSGAFDINLGCSGYVYGLGLSQALINSGQATSILLLTTNTYSKYIDPGDRDSLTLFGDGASATLVVANDEPNHSIGPFVYGTDGSGAFDIIALNSGTHIEPQNSYTEAIYQDRRSVPAPRLVMQGKRVFDFVLEVVPKSVEALVRKAGIKKEDVDLFVFHQANAFILEELRKILGIPVEKFQVTISHCGNTGSSTIPIALKHAQYEGKLAVGSLVMVVGFGVGYSWGATLIRWRAK